MPLYEYECAACGERTELIQRLADPPLSECPKCGGSVSKLLSAPSFQFKGSGWYVTDYAGKSSGNTKSGETSTSKDKAPSSEKTTAKKESGGTSSD